MSLHTDIIETVEGFYTIIPLIPFRKTPGVSFDILPKRLVPKTDSIDRVLHESSAQSPGPVGNCERPWYMHPSQADNLMVLQGVRHVDIYTKEHGLAHFDVYPDRLEKDGKIYCAESCMLLWPCGVFHRIVSGAQGSASVNFATHFPHWDVKTNFNIYSLDTDTGAFELIRSGYEDQANIED